MIEMYSETCPYQTLKNLQNLSIPNPGNPKICLYQTLEIPKPVYTKPWKIPKTCLYQTLEN